MNQREIETQNQIDFLFSQKKADDGMAEGLAYRIDPKLSLLVAGTSDLEIKAKAQAAREAMEALFVTLRDNGLIELIKP